MVVCSTCNKQVKRGQECQSCTKGKTNMDDPDKSGSADGQPKTVQVYVNELLSYAVHYYQSGTNLNLKRVIEEEFDHEDIKAAKKLLSDLGLEMETPDCRRTSPNRSALEADVADLMTGLGNLDQTQEITPIFACVDHSKVPMTLPPEEACSTVSMAIRLAKVEAMLGSLRKDVVEQTENVGTLFEMMAHKPTYAAATSQPSASQRDAAIGGTPGGSNATISVGMALQGATQQQQRRPPTKSDKGDTTIQQEDGDGFRKPPGHLRNDERRKKRKEKLIIGTKTDSTLKSDSGTISIMVKFVDKKYQNEDITKHATEIEGGVEVHAVETVSNPNARTKSFRVEINYKDKDKVLDGKH